MTNLRVTYIQTPLVWQNPVANLASLSTQLEGIAGTTDLIVLPEMFSTGFSMETSLAETMQGKSVAWMIQQAEIHQAAITGSLMIREGDAVYNRMVWISADGKLQHYDKRHLFRMANEQEHFEPGNQSCIVELNGWKIRLLVCYDLRFPVWSRNHFEAGTYSYDALIYVANWPERRSHAWKSLLPARAIENLAYVIGVNRVGQDGNGIEYTGDSAVINYLGEVVSANHPGSSCRETILLSYETLQSYRKSFPAGLDADAFTIEA